MLNPLSTTPDGEPAFFVKGDTLLWKRSDLQADFPNSDYTLSYAFVSRSPSGVFTITATADGEDYVVSVAKATTGGYTASNRKIAGQSGYVWDAYVTHISTGERFRVDRGTLDLIEDISGESAGYDQRSHVKKTLDLLETAIEGRASKTDLEYEINGRSLTRMSHKELMDARDRYAALYAQELLEESANNNRGRRRLISTRFSNWTRGL